MSDGNARSFVNGSEEPRARFSTRDVDELHEVCQSRLGLDASFMQISRGRFEHSLVAAPLSCGWAVRRDCEGVLETRLGLGLGVVGIAYISRCDRPFTVNGLPVSQGDLVVGLPGETLDLTSPDQFSVIAFDLHVDTLDGFGDAIGLHIRRPASQGVSVVSLAPGEARAMLDVDRGILRGRGHGSAHGCVEAESRLLASLSTILERLHGPAPHRDQDSVQARHLRSARAYIEDRLGETIVIDELCTAVGVSLRTLQYCFRTEYGVSPSAYIRARRLHEARRLLSKARPGERTVTSIAVSCGFGHLARFAAYYKEMFGELPRDTLAR